MKIYDMLWEVEEIVLFGFFFFYNNGLIEMFVWIIRIIISKLLVENVSE